MNQHLQKILDTIKGDKNLSEEEKNAIIKSLQDADKEFEITNFKLDRTEKVKKTTAILLEETIEELEQKRKAVEAQNKELEIESSLERIRTVAMGMVKPDDLLNICQTQFHELKQLGFDDLRNALIGIYHDEEGYFTDYDYSDYAGGNIHKIPYNENSLVDRTLKQMKSSDDAFTEFIVNGEELEQWKLFRKQNGEYDDIRIENAAVLYYYFYSISRGNIGLSTFKKLSESQLNILKRFRNVFDLAYQRYVDISQAETQAREAQIEAALERVRSRTMGMQKSGELKEVIQLVYEQLVHLNIDVEHAGFLIDYKERDDLHIWLADKNVIPSEIIIPCFDAPPNNSIREAKEKGKDSFSYQLTFEEKNRFYRDLFKFIPGVPEDTKEYYQHCPGLAGSGVLLDNIGLYIENFTGSAYTDKENNTLMRFGKVFQQTYTRFLDLQKAELQSREVKIQLALERARAQSMMMQHSTELDDTLRVFHEQVLLLNIPSAFSFLWLPDEAKDRHIFWAAWAENNLFKSKAIDYPLDRDEPATAQCLIDWKGTEPVVSYHVPPDGIKNYFAAWSELIGGVEQLKPEYFSDGLYYVEAFLKYGCFGVIVKTDMTEGEKKILLRFAIEFERTYTRFLDLQKAEAQAREAQIEVAVERVRAKALAMHKSEEILQVAATLKQQLETLDLKGVTAATIYLEQNNGNIRVWDITGLKDEAEGPQLAGDFQFKLEDTDPGLWVRRVWNAKEKYSVVEMSGDDFNKCEKWLRGFDKKTADDYLQFVEEAGLKHSWHPTVQLEHGKLNIDFILPPPAEMELILPKMGVAFDLAYKRFLDLQKAEAQAKEAKIEAALERVRSRSLAMHHSSELSAVVDTLLREFTNLEFTLTFCIINLIDEQDRSNTVWAANPETGKDPESYYMKFEDYPFHHAMWDAWKEQKKNFIYTIEGKEKEIYDEYLYNRTEFRRFPKHVQEANKALKRYVAGFTFFKYSGLQTVSENNISDEELAILERFGRVFEQSYTRFLDLQKAEAQAREAQIETALEKVRSRTMAMQRSDELAGTAALLFQEFKKLVQQELIQTTIGIYNEEKNEIEFRATDWVGSGEQVNRPAYGSMDEPTLLKPAVTAWRAREKSLVVELSGETLEQWTNYRNKMTNTTIATKFDGGRRVISIAFFSKGHLSMSSPLPLPAETVKTLERFAAVFDGTYTRFLDLQKAETQAREAQVETALEKVRSRTLAMQHSNELAETAAVLFQQLILLGIQPNRLYISIVKGDSGNAEFWITDEDGTKVSSAFETNLHSNNTFKKMFDGWKSERKSLVIDMHGDELQEYFKYLESIHVPFKGGLEQKRRLQNIAFFNNGFIGIASPDELPEETILLLERFAAVFNLTFTRFNDLKIAEAHALQAEQDLAAIKEAKQKAETALIELQATQQQLVQSEKMASLGELTAGIAHEIQNPLNFVNNFSEVSKELLDEMKDELDKGNLEDAKEIMADVIQNLEKINHHGKRADGIVKGMLQHSRSSTGQKEPTDINALADEYLRLAYHGLRAKDKSFNATFKTDLDPSAGKINIIPQDIGRVVLNLLTNAFYVVNEKKQQKKEGYEPTVIVSTKKLNDKVEVRVTDNGNGIPQKVLDKIFQPFFTTKPTGLGTGLGLSLSYDIITKGHNGELKVETEENEGSTFIIQLPAN